MSRTHLNFCPKCDPDQERETYAPAHYDGHGIFLFYACEACAASALKHFRPDIMERYECDEPIEPEDAY
jgi:hypothetical protein